MTGRDLKATRIRLEGDGHKSVKRMAEKLETPKRTCQDWEARKGVVPGVVSVAVKALLLLAQIDATVEAENHEEVQSEVVPNQT
jgi:hypothetical protein